jgi:hypothetical protein
MGAFKWDLFFIIATEYVMLSADSSVPKPPISSLPNAMQNAIQCPVSRVLHAIKV